MIYEHWFVQFDFPDTNGKPYKSSGGAMVWNEELKQEIPDGWRVVSFADIVDIEKDSVAPDEFKHLTVEHYSIPAFDEKHWPTFEYGTEIASNKFRVNNREFLVSKLNPQFKRIWNPICKTENALCSTEFMVFKPKNDEMKSYCYSVADGIAFYNFMVAHASSSTGSRKRFPAENIQFFKFAHPGKNAILEQFDSIQKENLIQISLCYASIEKLIALRDWLLPMLMNGQVTVGE